MLRWTGLILRSVSLPRGASALEQERQRRRRETIWSRDQSWPPKFIAVNDYLKWPAPLARPPRDARALLSK